MLMVPVPSSPAMMAMGMIHRKRKAVVSRFSGLSG